MGFGEIPGVSQVWAWQASAMTQVEELAHVRPGTWRTIWLTGTRKDGGKKQG